MSEQLLGDLGVYVREKAKSIPAGGGYGAKTVGEVCGQLDIDLELGLERLRTRGI